MKSPNLNLSPKAILAQLASFVRKIKKYLPIFTVLVLLVVYGFLIMQISSASQQEPDEDEITLQLSTIKRLQIDQDAVDKVQQLKDQNIEVQTLFEAARNDPFKE